MRVALVHDYLNQRGGAERVLLTISDLFPEAPIFTSVFDPDGTFEEFRHKDVRTTFLQRLPHSAEVFRALLPLYPAAFRSIDLSGYDLVISNTTNWAHRVRAPGAVHVVFCHNPPRWLYQTQDYLGRGGMPRVARPFLRPLLWVLRRGDAKAAARPDLYVAISRVVEERIRRTYGRDAPVVNSPVDVGLFEKALTARSKGLSEGHYLVVSRLLPYKRVDLAVDACTRRGAPLVVVGDGPARKSLEAIAGPSVRFAGTVYDEELINLYAGARAAIHCAEEDFGLVPLEANSAGIPCVAFGNGGALETVIPGETGILFPEQTGGALMKALDEVESRAWDQAALWRHARRFDRTSFQLRFLRAINDSLEGSDS